jgi:hypothetical protein
MTSLRLLKTHPGYVRRKRPGRFRPSLCFHAPQRAAYTANTATTSLQSLLPRLPHARTCTWYCVPGSRPASVTRPLELMSVSVYAVGAAAVA